jgi:hypothetical protein
MSARGIVGPSFPLSTGTSARFPQFDIVLETFFRIIKLNEFEKTELATQRAQGQVFTTINFWVLCTTNVQNL